MNRYFFWLFLVLPFIGLITLIKSAKNPDLTLALIVLTLYLAAIFNIRRKYLGMSIKDVLISFVPVYGFKQRIRLHFGK